MPTFTYTPSFDLTETSEPRIRRFQGGDSFEQRVRMGLNADPKIWNLEFSNRTDMEANGIAAFLESVGGSDSFDWTPPPRLGGNRLLWSEGFDNSVWGKSSVVVVSSNTQVAPNGTTTADTIVEQSGASGFRLFLQASPTGATLGLIYTLSCYVKQGTGTRNFAITAHGEPFAIFNVTSGTIASVGTPAQASIVSAGNGWWRCSMTYQKTNTNSNVYFGLANGTSPSFSGDGTSSLHGWGAQLEIGSTPTDYKPTTSSMSGVRDIPGKYVCENWSYTARNANNNTIQAKFRQVFEY